MEFLFLFLYRALSGGQNGLGYAQSKWMWVATLVMMIFMASGLVYSSHNPSDNWMPWHFVAITCFAVALISALMVHLSFVIKHRYFDIHFWESVTTGLATIAVVFAGADLILVACAVYPGLIFHKGFVNIGGGLNFFDNQTDDPSGKTFNIPLLGIRIPRSGSFTRLSIAVVSLVMALLYYLFGWSIVLFG